MSEEIRQFRGPADNEPRVESGVIQFGRDWPGIFVRGDEAKIYSLSLEYLIKAMTDARYQSGIEAQVHLNYCRALLEQLKQTELIRKDGRAV
jgi:hypothetical protein